MLVHIDGSAGTGKSYLIDTVSAYLAERARSDDRRDPVVQGAPTGIAVHNISGPTLHSLLRLPVRSNEVPVNFTKRNLTKSPWRALRSFSAWIRG
jgi:PIF1-like helicase